MILYDLYTLDFRDMAISLYHSYLSPCGGALHAPMFFYHTLHQPSYLSPCGGALQAPIFFYHTLHQPLNIARSHPYIFLSNIHHAMQEEERQMPLLQRLERQTQRAKDKVMSQDVLRRYVEYVNSPWFWLCCMFRGLVLYSAVVIFHIQWCTRKPWSSSIILYNNISIA